MSTVDLAHKTILMAGDGDIIRSTGEIADFSTIPDAA